MVDGREDLGVDGSKGGVGDVSAPESATDDDAERVGVDVPDIGRRFDDAASDEASLLRFAKVAGGEGVREDVIIQTRNTAEPIDRDSANFINNVSQGRVSEI